MSRCTPALASALTLAVALGGCMDIATRPLADADLHPVAVEGEWEPMVEYMDMVGGYPIHLYFVGEFPYWAKGAVMQAAHRWSHVLGPTPVAPYHTANEVWQCGYGTEARFARPIKGTAIAVFNVEIEGVLGVSTGCLSASSLEPWANPVTGTPLVGSIGIALSQYDGFPPHLAAPGVERTAAHEIGHVLGIGLRTPWYESIRGREGADPHRPTPAAIREFEYWDSVRVARYGGEDGVCRKYTDSLYHAACDRYTASKVPVHAIRDFHWNLCIGDDVMSEIGVVQTPPSDDMAMEPHDNSGRTASRIGPITSITLAALEDYGFQYDRRLAEPPRLTRVFATRWFFDVYDERHSCKRGWNLQ